MTIDERKREHDKEQLIKLRKARDSATELILKHGLDYPDWISDISYVLGYFEGRCGVFTDA